MKKAFGFLVLVVGLSGCFGYTAKDNELTGQVKKVTNQTPLICPDRVDADISMGVMRNGVGSMSAQDIWFSVPGKEDQAALRKAAESGEIVTVTYDVARVTFCMNDHIVTSVKPTK